MAKPFEPTMICANTSEPLRLVCKRKYWILRAEIGSSFGYRTMEGGTNNDSVTSFLCAVLLDLLRS